MARHHEREAVLCAERSGRACRPGSPGERGQLAVADDLAPRHLAQRTCQLALEVGAPGEVEREVVISGLGAGQMVADARRQATGEPVVRVGTVDADPRVGQVVGEHNIAGDDQLPHAPAVDRVAVARLAHATYGTAPPA